MLADYYFHVGCVPANVESLVSSSSGDWYGDDIVYAEDESCAVRLDFANGKVIVDVSGF